jgi:membrane-associated phospholipid phosphatase
VADGRAGRLKAFPIAARPAPRWPLVIWGAILLALMVGLRYWVDHVGPLPGDRWQAGRLLFHSNQSAVLVQLETFFGTLGTGTIAGVTVFVAFVILVRRYGRAVAAGLLLSGLAVAWNALLKHLFGPTRLFHHVFVTAPFPVVGGDNYPSGHVTYAMAIFGYIAVMARRRGALEVSVIAALLVLGMGPARILAGDHLISDVIGGYLLGAGWLLVVLGLEPFWARASLPLVETEARRQDVRGQVRETKL